MNTNHMEVKEKKIYVKLYKILVLFFYNGVSALIQKNGAIVLFTETFNATFVAKL